MTPAINDVTYAASWLSVEEVYALTPLIIASCQAWGDRLNHAEDVAADVVADMVRRGGAPSVAYVMTAARHGLSSRYRRKRALSFDELTVPPATEAPGFDAVDGRLEALSVVSGAGLSPRHLRVLELRFGGDLTFAEVGAALGVNAHHATNLCTDAIGKLRDANGVPRPARRGRPRRDWSAKAERRRAAYLAIPRDPERQAAAERPGGRRGRLRTAA